MSKSPIADIDFNILLWARESAGLEVNTVAKKIPTKPERVLEWESGISQPTVKQLRKVSRIYMRPIGLFFLPELPDDPESIKDFRRISDHTREEFSSALHFEIRLAWERRFEALDLAVDLGEKSKIINFEVDLSIAPDKVATELRKLLGISIHDQLGWRTKREAFNSWRGAVESIGVLVFQTGIFRNLIVDPEEARGFSISEQPFPVIVVNGKDHPSAKCFTLIHELTHILLHDGGVCDLHNPFTPHTDIDHIEIYCNHVAGAFLVPEANLLGHTIVKNHGSNPQWSDDEIGQLSRSFWVSYEVILRRLLIYGKTNREFYNQWREERNDLFPGRADQGEVRIPTHTRVIIKNGKLFPRLVIQALRNNFITTFEASDLLRANPLRLGDIENAIF